MFVESTDINAINRSICSSLLSRVESPKYLEALSEYVAKNEYNSWIEAHEIFIQMKLCSDDEIQLIVNDLVQLYDLVQLDE
ncbi:unnamed protein product [Oppiella nova]|uniref:Uncharacterized protein n=1 Tax=Oppiella nova TaxID=334625 RepID=A0A7R9MH94_9ACAR|nr:unnamed protein product [Oppiella nova]CAG2177318.1 unnamed protein product [Oppiella nova]